MLNLTWILVNVWSLWSQTGCDWSPADEHWAPEASSLEEVGQNEGFCFVLLTHLCRLLWGPFPFLFKTAVAPEYFINSGFRHYLHLHFLQQSKIIKSEHSWGYENQNNRTYLYLDSVEWGYKG